MACYLQEIHFKYSRIDMLKVKRLNWAWWSHARHPSVGKMRQEDKEFRASLSTQSYLKRANQAQEMVQRAKVLAAPPDDLS